jgi:hypothetical protein
MDVKVRNSMVSALFVLTNVTIDSFMGSASHAIISKTAASRFSYNWLMLVDPSRERAGQKLGTDLHWDAFWTTELHGLDFCEFSI